MSEGTGEGCFSLSLSDYDVDVPPRYLLPQLQRADHHKDGNPSPSQLLLEPSNLPHMPLELRTERDPDGRWPRLDSIAKERRRHSWVPKRRLDSERHDPEPEPAVEREPAPRATPLVHNSRQSFPLLQPQRLPSDVELLLELLSLKVALQSRQRSSL
mgnify:FL=1